MRHRRPEPRRRSDEARDPLCRVTKAAADVQHALTRAWRNEAQSLLAMHAEPRRHEMAKTDKRVEQRPVPRPDRLLVGGRDLLHA